MGFTPIKMWVFYVNTGTFNNPSFKVPVASPKKPTNEAFKKWWDSFNSAELSLLKNPSVYAYRIVRVEESSIKNWGYVNAN